MASAAFGVGFPYKISLRPGETTEEIFSIQNVLEPTEEITLQITVENGEEYIQFPEGTTINLARNEIKNVPVKISIPKNTKAEKYNVRILFQPASTSQAQGGTIDLVLAIKKSFDIEIIKEENKNLKLIIGILIAIAIVLIAILIKILNGKKKK